MQDFLVKGPVVDELTKIGYHLSKDRRLTKEDYNNLSAVLAAIHQYNEGIRMKIMSGVE